MKKIYRIFLSIMNHILHITYKLSNHSKTIYIFCLHSQIILQIEFQQNAMTKLPHSFVCHCITAIFLNVSVASAEQPNNPWRTVSVCWPSKGGCVALSRLNPLNRTAGPASITFDVCISINDQHQKPRGRAFTSCLGGPRYDSWQNQTKDL